MTPCGIKWCTALADGQFCVVHAKQKDLHPTESGPFEFTEEDLEEAREEGFKTGMVEGDAEGYERGVAEHD